jgi:hypothetical protein
LYKLIKVLGKKSVNVNDAARRSDDVRRSDVTVRRKSADIAAMTTAVITAVTTMMVKAVAISTS